MNKKQKITLTILVPIIIFIGALGISANINSFNVFDWEDTWFVWFVAGILIIIVENYLLKD